MHIAIHNLNSPHRGVILFVAFCSLIGCVFYGNKPYPKEWPEITPVGLSQCPDLTGTYSNYGICEKDSGTIWKDCPQTSLESAFFEWNSIGPKANEYKSRTNVDAVELSHPSPNSLDIALRAGTKPKDGKHELLLDRRILKRESNQLVWGVSGLSSHILRMLTVLVAMPACFVYLKIARAPP
jgi:hypothetical protein